MTLRIGIDHGEASQVVRACGVPWAGPAIRGCREVLYRAPPHSGLFLTAAAVLRYQPDQDRQRFALQPLGDGHGGMAWLPASPDCPPPSLRTPVID